MAGIQAPTFESNDDPSVVTYEWMATIHNACFPDWPVTADDVRHERESRDPSKFIERYLVRVQGEVVGYAETGHLQMSHREGKYFLHTQIHPDHEEATLATLTFLMGRLQQRGYDHLISYTRTDKSHRIEALERLGFACLQKNPDVRLDLEPFDPSLWTESLTRVAALGYRLVTLEELGDSEDVWRAYYDLDWELMQDVPYTDSFTKRPFEVWVDQIKTPQFDPSLFHFALRGDEWVGMTECYWSGADHVIAGTGLTGVRRPHRRVGVATALKVKALCDLKRRGAKLIRSDNEESNPMLDLNYRLGFRSTGAWLHYELKVE